MKNLIKLTTQLKSTKVCQVQSIRQFSNQFVLNAKNDKNQNVQPRQFEDSSPSYSVLSGHVKFSGRSVPVKDNNPMKAYSTLNSIITQSGLRQVLRNKRAYEKPSVKRRRLRMEGNRKRFKDAVAKKVGLVLQMKNRGV